jgi:hypothetical protein
MIRTNECAEQSFIGSNAAGLFFKKMSVLYGMMFFSRLLYGRTFYRVGLGGQCVVLVSWRPVFNFFEISILKFQKIQRKILHVDNHDFYPYAKN